MIQWEYKVRLLNALAGSGSPGGVKELEFLEEQGKQGWELCAIYFDQYAGRFYYFKRQITENK